MGRRALTLGAMAIAAVVALPPLRAQETLFTREGGPIVPGVPTSVANCGACHADEQHAWEGSAHAQAYTDPVFQAEYRAGPSPFCRHCHAPRATDEAPDLLAEVGVDCATCHVREGVIYGTRALDTSAHAVLREPRLSTEEACAACHEFAFPPLGSGALVGYAPGAPLQRTVSEWREAGGQRACASCHMPRGDHALLGLRDAAFVASAVRVRARATRVDETTRVEVRIQPRAAAHAFPTGDMFRRARVTVSAAGATRSEDLMRFFASTIDDDGRAFHLREVVDGRVRADRGARVTLLLGVRARTVAWSLDLFRLDPDVARARGLSDEQVRVGVAAGSVRVGGSSAVR